MRAFWLIWIGQLVSLLGSGMTQFAITLWAYRVTGSATALALIGVFFLTPLLVMSPVVGVMVDRHDRKLMMMLSDLAAGLTTVAIFALYLAGRLEVWHLYVTAAVNGVFQGFQWPAYSAALSTMIPKSEYVRANSLMEIVGPGSGIVAPMLAGAVIGLGDARGFDGFRAILAFDILSFGAAIGALLFVHIPAPPRSADGPDAGAGWWAEATHGLRYILARPELLGLQGVFLVGNLLFNMTEGTLLAPLLLARTGSNAWIFGSAQAVGSVGTVVGGLVVGAWGGFRRRVHGVLAGWAAAFAFGAVLVGLGRPEPPWMLGLWAVGIFVAGAMAPLINGSNQAIWMAKVAPGVQGRVFAARRLIAWIASPLAALIAGPLADRVMEPAMREGGRLAPIFGPVVGVGPGAGMAVLFVVLGITGITFSLAMYMVPAVRDAEARLADHGGVGD